MMFLTQPIRNVKHFDHVFTFRFPGVLELLFHGFQNERAIYPIRSDLTVES